MILLKFNPEELGEARTVPQIYGVFGIGNEPENEISWKDQRVFGERADVKNIFCTQHIYDLVNDNINQSVLKGKNNLHKQMDTHELHDSWNWAMYSPTTSGPRYEAMLKSLRAVADLDELPDSVVAILTPEDSLYEPPRGGEF